jgi:hypothetical protein
MHFRLTPPRILILFVSLILAAAAVATLYMHVPIFGHYVATHRFWVMTAAYTVFLAGVPIATDIYAPFIFMRHNTY